MSDHPGKAGGGISGRISRSASALEPVGTSPEQFLSEASFVDNLRKLNQQLSYDRDRHDFQAEQEKHKFRKNFLWALFILTCVWLVIVIIFVAWNAVNPSIEDRGKLVQMQMEIGSASNATNSMYADAIKTARPHYCSILFHLSDSVLIAFITSTTVAVLGLFLTAARWLFGGRQVEKPPAEKV